MDPHTAAPAAAVRPRALDAPSLCHAFQITAAERPDAIALRNPGDGVSISWREYAERVERLAAGLAAIGVERGDTVGLMLLNRPEFHLVDTAALHLGATPFSMYNTSTPEQIAYLFSNAGNRVVVTEHHFLPAVLAARRSMAGLAHVILVDGSADDVISLEQLEAAGNSRFRFADAWHAVGADDLATIIYTSGTTGPPKGVEITHANALAQCVATTERFPLAAAGTTLSYLPAAHVVDRWANHWWTSMMHGFTVTSIADMRTVIFLLPSERPTLWGGVPRIWEKLKAALVGQGIHDPATLPDEKRDALRARLGLDQAQFHLAGAAPMPVDVLRYFDALGVPIAECWGMSETSGCGTANPPGAIRHGTCGPPLPGVELQLAHDDELLVRGPIVARGYRGDPEGTAAAFGDDGWLRTGDVAHVDDDGYVSIVDRKKELIINAGGKNMSPANIEARLTAASTLIGHAVAIGDRRPYNVALIVLEPDVAAAFARERGIEDPSPAALAAHPAVRDAVARAVEAGNGHLSRVERIKRFAIVPGPWEAGGDELTPTLKLRRRPIALKYGREIDALYSSGSGRFSPGHAPVR